ncbi:hypothetical protein BS639_22055 [Rouxiella silvae]|uniref:Uncharacterized protein n=1 Tax=Rouxiella silvae TaxID=1646373 RepID=A0AA40X3B6_9GAMM|nr:hypothetical protein [Rouxiella silvae]MBF6637412.1 hypothetical protein [Rouxiella silvae]ORJ19068.1 hypothetical protein BS639_22055 [Rouxiella silvae]
MFSKDHRINMHINNGLFNGKTVYIHYTSKEGLDAIKMQRKISANPNSERRGTNAKKGVYLTFAKDAMNGMNAHNLLFFGEEKYALSALYCVIFVFNNPLYLRSAPVTSGSHVTEVISLSDIYFHQINIIYEGKNPFI